MYFGAMIRHFHFTQIDSTNALARKWITNGLIPAATLTTITADSQTNGRGTKGRIWVSDDEGGLYFSAILPNTHFTSADAIKIAGIVQKTVLNLAKIKLEIEWPNDLIFNGKKVSGILLEQVNTSIIVGIGLNVNQSRFPDSLVPVATSLAQITGRTFSKTAFSLELSKELLNEVSRH